MDEFAFRKGCTYGTVLVDVEAGQVVDALPDRTAGTFADWLRAHRGVEIICRDRATAYTRALREAAPHAQWRSPTAGTCCRTCPQPSKRPATSTATACANTLRTKHPHATSPEPTIGGAARSSALARSPCRRRRLGRLRA
ncbi:transposase [Streptomyces sp. NPDC019645]|uniref:transposase n=1 Tax=Streptomyces sp. NPDC019645 TaxID=3154786 RepID=UPI0034088389